MKIFKKSTIIVLMIFFFAILGTKVEATTGTVNSETVRLRKEPNTKSTILDQLDHGDEVEILEQEEGWYKVKAKTEQGTITGYISEKLLDVKGEVESNDDETTETSTDTVETNDVEKTPTEPEAQPTEPETNVNEQPIEEAPVETVPEANITDKIEEKQVYTLNQEVTIKALPLINSIEKAKISGNIQVIEIINDWCRIENDTEDGWIRTNILKNMILSSNTQVEVPEQQPEEQQPQEEPVVDSNQQEEEQPEETDDTETVTPLSKKGYVSAEGLRVRKEPTTDSEELDSLKKNDEVEITGKSGNWYQINLNGEVGYVSSKYISDTKLPETTSRDGSSLENVPTTTEPEQEETPIVEETPATPENTEETTTGTTGAAVVEYAKQYLGYKYVSGGASPSTGFDCSGFTSYVYKHFGITLNRTSKDQIKNGVSVERSDLQLGDIVLFNNDANTAIGHVGIYIGGDNFIHASNPSDGVKITSLSSSYYKTRYVGARRVI